MNLETICISGAIIAIPRLRPTNYNGSCSEQRAKNIHYLSCCEIYLLSLKNRWRMATRIQGEPEVCFLHFSTKWRREKLRKHRYSCQTSTQSKIYRPWNRNKRLSQHFILDGNNSYKNFLFIFVKIKTPLYLTILSLLQEKVTMDITFRVMQELSFLTSLLYLASSLGPRLALDMKKLISVSGEDEESVSPGVQRPPACHGLGWRSRDQRYGHQGPAAHTRVTEHFTITALSHLRNY